MVDARLLDDRTIYSRTGDVVAWLSVALLAWPSCSRCALAAGVPAFDMLESMAFVLDEQVRRYQDLVKRTSDLRSYL